MQVAQGLARSAWHRVPESADVPRSELGTDLLQPGPEALRDRTSPGRGRGCGMGGGSDPRWGRGCRMGRGRGGTAHPAGSDRFSLSRAPPAGIAPVNAISVSSPCSMTEKEVPEPPASPASGGKPKSRVSGCPQGSLGGRGKPPLYHHPATAPRGFGRRGVPGGTLIQPGVGRAFPRSMRCSGTTASSFCGAFTGLGGGSPSSEHS